jgi:hypothetical protein
MYFVVSNNWAKAEFRQAIVWDRRCLKSLSTMAKAVYENTSMSFSSACGKSLRQCGSRIFSEETMSVDNMQAGHYKETARRAARYDTVLVAQDTTSFNYSGHKATEGLGPIGTDVNTKGLMCHSAMVLREDGLPLGIIGQKLWARSEEDYGKKHKRKELAFEEKESFKWAEGLSWAQERLPGKINEIWVIADRESDVYEYMSSDLKPNVKLLLRACQPRTIEAEISGEKKRGNLMKLVKQLPVIARKEVELTRDKKVITVTLEVSAINIRLMPPARKAKMAPLDMSVVYATEGGPESEDKVEWVLLSFKQDLTPEDALLMVNYYTQRWKIERLHYTLKSGVYEVEKLQFDDAATLMNALSFYSVVGWRMLFITYYARLEPEAPAEELIDKDEKEVLEAYVRGEVATALDVVKAIGKLGGFLGGTKRYPYPGVKILWIGLVKLTGMKQGWLLAKAHFKKR